jgi:hypothetical protein
MKRNELLQNASLRYYAPCWETSDVRYSEACKWKPVNPFSCRNVYNLSVRRKSSAACAPAKLTEARGLIAEEGNVKPYRGE